MRAGDWLTIVIVVLAARMAAVYFEYTADDAYILVRYGVNLVERGALVYNVGEQVSALTQPAMALTYALLAAVSSRPVLVYACLSLGLLAWTSLRVAKAAGGDSWVRAMALAIVPLSPCVTLWTTGGLETPILMALVTGVTTLVLEPEKIGPGRCVGICVLCGLAAFWRYDAVCFAAPVALFALAKQPARTRLLGVGAGAAVPAAWLLFALSYYGDILPTSFYVKTPGLELGKLSGNALYVGLFLIFTGVLPFAACLAALPGGRARLAATARRLWGPVLGIALVLAYGLTSATTHMMFSFRYFVPYLPATTMLLAVAAVRDAPVSFPERNRQLAALASVLVAFQVFHGWYTYAHSINGLSLNGELRRTGVVHMERIMREWAGMAAASRSHWESLGKPAGTHPRIFTLAEGVLPYLYPEARFYGTLVSYRHECRPNLVNSADYAVWPFTMAEFQDGPAAKAQVYAKPIFWERRLYMLTLTHNPEPAPHVLPPRLAGPCLEPDENAGASATPPGPIEARPGR